MTLEHQIIIHIINKKNTGKHTFSYLNMLPEHVSTHTALFDTRPVLKSIEF